MKGVKSIQNTFTYGLFLIFCMVAVTVSPSATNALTLTFATNTPPSNNMRGDAESIFIEELEKASGGKIKIKAFWAESLLKNKEILKGVADGIVDMGHVNIAHNPKRLVRNTAFILTNEGPTQYENKMRAFRRAYAEIPELTAEIRRFKQRTVYMYNTSAAGICANKPINKLGDVANLKLRASNPFTLSVLKDLGATPVSLAWGDLYISLQTNAIQGVVTNFDAFHRNKLYEAAPHVFLMTRLWIPLPYLITINEKKWQKLPADLKKAFEVAAVNAHRRYTVEWEKWFEKIFSDMRRSGATITNASDSDYDKWLSSKAHKRNQQYWVKAVSRGGVKNGAELLSKIQAIVADEVRKEQ